MQRAVVVGLTLTCVCLVFALSGPSAQRIAPEPSAPSTRPSQVEVTNFPAVQQVAGTVSVGNLPAVQSVAGSVQVTNLPTDAGGNLRVAGLAPAPAYRWTKIADGVPVLQTSPSSIGPFPVGGWREAHLLSRVTITSGNAAQFIAQSQSGGEGLLIDSGYAGSTSFDPAAGIPQTFVMSGGAAIVGPELNIRFTLTSNDQTATAVVNEMWLYLSN